MPPDPLDLWRRARELGDNPHGQWTYPLLACRAVAAERDGMRRSYEHVRSWEHVTAALSLSAELDALGVPPKDTYAVNLGMEMFDGAYYAPAGKLRLPRRSEPFRGRHSVRAVAFDGQRLVFANSWGRRWGDAGVGYIPRDYFEAHVDLVIVWRTALVGPSPALTGELTRRRWRSGDLTRSVTTADLASAWHVPSPLITRTVRHAGDHANLTMRELTSLAHLPMHVLELRSEAGFIGRAHLHHQGAGASVAEELWIAPAERRAGFGMKRPRFDAVSF